MESKTFDLQHKNLFLRSELFSIFMLQFIIKQEHFNKKNCIFSINFLSFIYISSVVVELDAIP
jgi:hypothetical protein